MKKSHTQNSDIKNAEGYQLLDRNQSRTAADNDGSYRKQLTSTSNISDQQLDSHPSNSSSNGSLDYCVVMLSPNDSSPSENGSRDRLEDYSESPSYNSSWSHVHDSLSSLTTKMKSLLQDDPPSRPFPKPKVVYDYRTPKKLPPQNLSAANKEKKDVYKQLKQRIEEHDKAQLASKPDLNSIIVDGASALVGGVLVASYVVLSTVFDTKPESPMINDDMQSKQGGISSSPISGAPNSVRSASSVMSGNSSTMTEDQGTGLKSLVYDSSESVLTEIVSPRQQRMSSACQDPNAGVSNGDMSYDSCSEISDCCVESGGDDVVDIVGGDISGDAAKKIEVWDELHSSEDLNVIHNVNDTSDYTKKIQLQYEELQASSTELSSSNEIVDVAEDNVEKQGLVADGGNDLDIVGGDTDGDLADHVEVWDEINSAEDLNVVHDVNDKSDDMKEPQLQHAVIQATSTELSYDEKVIVAKDNIEKQPIEGDGVDIVGGDIADHMDVWNEINSAEEQNFIPLVDDTSDDMKEPQLQHEELQASSTELSSSNEIVDVTEDNVVEKQGLVPEATSSAGKEATIVIDHEIIISKQSPPHIHRNTVIVLTISAAIMGFCTAYIGLNLFRHNTQPSSHAQIPLAEINMNMNDPRIKVDGDGLSSHIMQQNSAGQSHGVGDYMSISMDNTLCDEILSDVSPIIENIKHSNPFDAELLSAKTLSPRSLSTEDFPFSVSNPYSVSYPRDKAEVRDASDMSFITNLVLPISPVELYAGAGYGHQNLYDSYETRMSNKFIDNAGSSLIPGKDNVNALNECVLEVKIIPLNDNNNIKHEITTEKRTNKLNIIQKYHMSSVLQHLPKRVLTHGLVIMTSTVRKLLAPYKRLIKRFFRGAYTIIKLLVAATVSFVNAMLEE